MPNQDFSVFLGDPLSEITRKERRNSLLASTLGTAIALMGIVPTKLSALGIDFSAPEQKYFLVLVAIVVVYFLFAFLTYGVADFFVWRQRYQSYLEHCEKSNLNWSYEDQRHYDNLHENIPRADWLYDFNVRVAWSRLGFDFLVPSLGGVFALTLLISKIARS